MVSVDLRLPAKVLFHVMKINMLVKKWLSVCLLLENEEREYKTNMKIENKVDIAKKRRLERGEKKKKKEREA